jgi:hypothetical protein
MRNPLLPVALVAILIVAGAVYWTQSQDDWQGEVTTTRDLVDEGQLGSDEVNANDKLLADHVESNVNYKTLPPVGGKHSAQWIACDFYEVAVPDEKAVHSLEHGAVWLTYKDSALSDKQRSFFTKAAQNSYVLVSPYPAQKEAFVATAWGLRMGMDSFDTQKLDAFIKEFANGPQTPEPGAPCRQGGVTP